MSEDPPIDTGETDASGYSYPLAPLDKEYNELKGKVPEVWFRDGFDFQAAVSSIEKPIVEIAGPSQGGYHILDGIKLPTKVHITNVVAEPMGMGEHSDLVDEIVDARAMPYPDASVGMILMHGLNGSVVPKGHAENSVEANQVQQRAKDQMRQVADGQLNPADATDSLRIQAYMEAYRVLPEGGMMIVGGAPAVDIGVLGRMGFELAGYNKETQTAEEREHSGLKESTSELVLIKPTAAKPE